MTLAAARDADQPSMLVGGPGNQGSPRFSPDGRYLAYESDEKGRPEIFVRRFPPTAEQWVVSPSGGSYPRWSRKGPELFYRSREGSIMAAPVTLGPTPGIGEPRRLFDESFTGATLSREFDVTADGQRFLAVRRAHGTTSRIVVVEQWLSEFGRP
jgi:Tol biopolymer transport system component